ncbi:cell division protein ZapA [Thermincola ferriacetica]
MQEKKTKVAVEIFGEEYKVIGDMPEEYIEMIAEYVDKKMKQIAAKNSRLSVTKVAVLAALNIADELCKLQEDYDTLVKLMDTEKKQA